MADCLSNTSFLWIQFLAQQRGWLEGPLPPWKLPKPLTRGVLLPKAAKKKRSSLLPLEYLEGRDSALDWLRSEASRSNCARFKAVSGDAAVVEEVLPETLKVRTKGLQAGDGKARQGDGTTVSL